MSEKVFHKILLITGLISLVHAAFSAAHYRTYLRLTEQDLNQLPLDIIIQTIVSLIFVVYSIIEVVVELKEIRATVDLQGKTWDSLSNLPSFYSFNHRGKALHPAYEPPSSGRDLLFAD